MLFNLFSSDKESPGFQEHEDHAQFKRRIRKTLYQSPKNNKPPLSLTELTVDYMKMTAPRQLGKTDMYTASSLLKDTFVPPCTLILAMMYAQRLRNDPSQQALDYLEDISSSDLLLVSMLVASKWLVDDGEDESTSHEEWTTATNLDSCELGLLEKNFLSIINWNLGVEKEDYLTFLLNIEQKIAWKQWGLRDYSTYSDLHVLTSHHSHPKNHHPNNPNHHPNNSNHHPNNPNYHPIHHDDQLKLVQALVQLISDVFKVTLTCTLAYLIMLTGISLTPPLAHHLTTLHTAPHLTTQPPILTIPPKPADISIDTSVNASLLNSSTHIRPFPVHHSTSHFDIISERNNRGLTNNQVKPLFNVPFYHDQIYLFKYISYLSFF